MINVQLMEAISIVFAVAGPPRTHDRQAFPPNQYNPWDVNREDQVANPYFRLKIQVVTENNK